MKKVLNTIFKENEKLIKKAAEPAWITPMAAMLTKKYFSDPAWIYECKFDGERVIAYKDGTEVILLTRNKINVNDTYPELVTALKKQKIKSFIIDGEVVAFKHGITSFETLSERMRLKNPERVKTNDVKVFYYIFDILYFDGYQITKLPLIKRKTILKNGLTFTNPLRYTEHKVGHGVDYYHQACKIGWEGIIAKNAASSYQSKRSSDWLKFKCVQVQEFVIGGYTEPQGGRAGFGALLLGYYDGKILKFAGKVGTGFDDALLQDLGSQLQKNEQKKCPFGADESLPKRKVFWVKPKLVAQIGFEEWTKYGKLRQPRFLGLREDKDAKDVVREDIKQLVGF
ncbi:MAG: non-homologous end-joining DNA ligase [Candidatus Babeliales bacterium]|nr:non-homologous end-joining DNA ligase [Candidatus Babeliales bacterium]